MIIFGAVDNAGKVHLGHINSDMFVSQCGLQFDIHSIGKDFQLIGSYKAITVDLGVSTLDAFFCRKCGSLLETIFN
jgi:hypothetical protein